MRGVFVGVCVCNTHAYIHVYMYMHIVSGRRERARVLFVLKFIYTHIYIHIYMYMHRAICTQDDYMYIGPRDGTQLCSH